MKPMLTIVRGHPGSGKTTWARAEAARTGARQIEADDWRYPGSGRYLWSAETDRLAHDWTALEALRWLRQDVPVIVANTFTKRADVERLEAICGKARRIVRLKGRFPNSHGVPEKFVLQCIEGYEPIEGEVVVIPPNCPPSLAPTRQVP